MEENALILNIATLIAKDITIDQNNHVKQPVHFLNKTTNPLPLLESDDEGFAFFMREQSKLEKTLKRKVSINETLESSGKRNYSNINNGLCMNLLKELDINVFESNLHLTKDTFKNILKTVSKYISSMIINDKLITVETILSLGLWKLATDEHFEEISRRFRVPLSHCHIIIRDFWTIISEHYESFIKWPNSHEAQMHCITGFQAMPELKSLKNMFGVIAIKRLDIFLESEDEETSVIMQIICSADHTIIDCFVELASEYSFEATPIGQTLEINPQTIPTNSYLIGDRSFPLKRYLMRPFEIECFRVESDFNKIMNLAVDNANQVLDKMTKRFNTLYALEAKDMTEVRKVIETICSLHNLCQEFGDDCIENGWKKPRTSVFPHINTDHGIKGNEINQYGKKIRFELMEKITAY